MKKFITIILIAIMALSLCACRVDNTEDYSEKKGNEESKTESDINLDECYVCSLVFNDSLYTDLATPHNNEDVFNDGQGYIKGYYIQGDIIYEYDVAYIFFDLNSNQYQVYEWDEGNYKVVEYHGVSKCIVRRWDYLLHKDCLGVFTWGELKQCIEEYNSAQKG